MSFRSASLPLDENPYQSPQTGSDTPRGILDYRCCPKCGTKVSWKRMWLKSWILAQWDCQGCGERLRFSVTRRVAMVLAFAASAATATAAGFALYWFVDSLWVFLPFAFAAIPAIFALGLIDGVRLASKPVPSRGFLVGGVVLFVGGLVALYLGVDSYLRSSETVAILGYVAFVGLMLASGLLLFCWMTIRRRGG